MDRGPTAPRPQACDRSLESMKVGQFSSHHAAMQRSFLWGNHDLGSLASSAAILAHPSSPVCWV